MDFNENLELAGEIEMISIFDIEPFDNNPRKNKDAIPEVVKSIQKHGMIQPIVVDDNNRIAAGHTRFYAMKELKARKVPCIRKSFLSEKEFIDFNLADNKTGEIAKWDAKSLKVCMEVLDGVERIDIPGFTMDEVDKIFGHKHEDIHSGDADFGDAGTVETEDPNAFIKRITFLFTTAEYQRIKSKLLAVQREHGLDTQAEALVQIMSTVKGLTKVKRNSKVKVIQ